MRAGQIHALVGQNGSGKSTLIKVLAGVHAADPGAAVTVGGEPLRLGVPGAGHQLGLRFVHQDLGLVPGLSVIDNLALGRGYGTGRLGQIRWRAEARQAPARPRRRGRPRRRYAAVSTLSTAERTGLAIARAVHDDEPAAEPNREAVAERPSAAPRAGKRATQVLVLDEPTAALPAADVDRLFGILRRLRDRGVGVVLVSHDLDEVLDVAGPRRSCATAASWPRCPARGSTTTGWSSSSWAGRPPPPPPAPRATAPRRPACRPTVWPVGRWPPPASLWAAARSWAWRGSRAPAASRSCRCSPASSRAGRVPCGWATGSSRRARLTERFAGMAFVPRERQAAGVFAAMNVRENLTIAGLRRFVSFGRSVAGLRLPRPPAGSSASAWSRPGPKL